MTRSSFSTIRTIISAHEEGQSDTGRLIVRREDDLNQHGRDGYTLTHTFTIATPRRSPSSTPCRRQSGTNAP